MWGKTSGVAKSSKYGVSIFNWCWWNGGGCLVIISNISMCSEPLLLLKTHLLKMAHAPVVGRKCQLTESS